MQKSKTLIPQLRFPEFIDGNNNVYKKYNFKDIFNFSTGKNIKQSEASPEFEIPCVRYGELYHMYKEIIIKTINNTNLNKSELLFSKGDEILLPSAGEDPLDIGSASALTLENVAIGRTINILRPLKDNVYSQKYVAYYINQVLKKKISTLAKGSSISNVYNSDLKKLEIILPNIFEQEKTADFFMSLDRKIGALEKKKNLLIQFKKGAIQKIFNQEVRFKDTNGNNYPDWCEKKLSDVLIERKEMSLKSSGLEHISLTKKGVVPKTVRYERDFLVNDDSAKKYKVTRLNDICYNPANLKFGVICRNKYGDGIFSPIYVTFEVKEGSYTFMEYFLVRAEFIAKARRYEEGTVYERMAVKPSDFITLKVKLPSLKEQQKIADFISILNRKITLVTNQIKQTKTFKKGLLQQMFV
ncbi:restriction endonuclease subunit S [Polaribacter atrinae]|uniref:restriction endonuclease subunit S n=1 Tax=Polaribacter atrinae TaxID=1333662 RepID=UPI0024917779|nr:restriction endonuclease subunit S [Polaribacter atrinae]